MAGFGVVLSTCGSLEEARRIAGALLERRLCACVNILAGVESVYRWQGKIESAQEHLLVIKTRTELAPRVQDAIAGLHSYDTPEAIFLPIGGGLERYLAWLEGETEGPPGTS